MNKPIITKSPNSYSSSMGNAEYSYFFDYGTNWNYTMCMTQEAFYMLCKHTGWELKVD